jgi:dienelactone hydrolase
MPNNFIHITARDDTFNMYCRRGHTYMFQFDHGTRLPYNTNKAAQPRPSKIMEDAMKLATFIAVMIAMLCTSAMATVQTREVEYRDGDTVMKGYIASDDAVQGKRPGILVVHEWWGHNAYARKRADMLAELGYTALAVDMYGDGKTANHPDDAGKFSGELRKNMPLATARFMAAMKLLQQEPSVDPRKIAAIGYCFGGGVVLEMARSGVDLDGVVSFHGSLAPAVPAKPATVKTKILVLNGADDPFVSAGEIDAFKKEMETAGVDYTFINYPGAVHSFTNPDADTFGREFNLPLAYNQEADEKSWQAMRNFFIDIFTK